MGRTCPRVSADDAGLRPNEWLFKIGRTGPRLAGMLTITRDLYDAIVAHARADHPDEACGIVAGPAGSDRPERFVPMANAERSPTVYRLDPAEQLKVLPGGGGRGQEHAVPH